MWLRWTLVTLLSLAWPASASGEPCPQPQLHISKHDGQLVLTCAGQERLRAAVSFGRNPRGTKQRSGDGRTPEGYYRICSKHPSRRYYRFFALNYPNGDDARTARAAGRITTEQLAAIERALTRGRCPPWNTPLGGAIGIHGVNDALHWALRAWHAVLRPTGLQRSLGFSEGCIVTDNETINQLWDAVDMGTPVSID